jgi:hypothetical protein
MPTEIDPNAAAPVGAPAAVPVVVPPAAQTADDPNNPPWLSERLARERKAVAKEADANARKAVLAELGIEDIDSIKKLSAEEKKRAEAQKSLETKNAEANAAIAAKDARNKELESSVKVFAEGQLATLSEAQKAAVLKVAGEDPAKQLNAIEALRPTWALVAPTAPAVPAQAPNGAATPAAAPPPAVVPPARPATATAPPAAAPPPAGSTVVPNHLEIYERLSNQSSPDYKPFAASAYLLTYGKEIEAARKARGSN